MPKTLQEYISYSFLKEPLKVLKTQVMHGANYFSAGPIVLIRLDLGSYNEVFTNQIEAFPEKLEKALPSLYEHHCSVGKKGGFLLRVNEGTLLGHVIEHVAIELQTLAGMDVGYGKTRSTLETGVYNIIFRFFDEVAGIYAGKAAVNLVNSLLTNQKFDCNEIVENLIDIREKRLLGPSTQAIVNEAEKRKIPFLRLDEYNLVQLGTGKYHKSVRATITSDTNFIAVETSDNKFLTSLMLTNAGIPMPETISADNTLDLLDFQKRLQKPIVVKPYEGYLGKSLTVNLKTEKEITNAFLQAKEFNDKVIAQPHVEGKSYRLLIIDYKFVAATELTPPYVSGNGALSVKQLIEQLNAQPERQQGDKGKLSIVEIDEITEKLLSDNELTLDSVLSTGKTIFLKTSGNMKFGGSAKDVTDTVNPFNIFLAERAARVIGLNVAGVDFITSDIAAPINENGGVIIEINAAPDFRMHLNPTDGVSRNVAKSLVDMLFPANEKTRVPIFSVTGTAGKTIAVLLLNYCLKQEGFTTGINTSDGLYIDDKCLFKGNMTYTEDVALVLKDPVIDCAITETSREGILRKGLGYKFADFGIVLNIHDEHVGVDDIEYIEDLAYAKSVVAEEVYEDGYSILNADNELVLEMKNRLYSKIALFSKQAQNKDVSAHILKGGLAVNIIDNVICVHHKTKSIQLIPLTDIPLTFGNKATFMYDQILASVAALFAFGVTIENIVKYLKSFLPTPENLPGRMNLIPIKGSMVLLDNAHNIINLQGLKSFLDNYTEEKIGVVYATGDRSDEQIMEIGATATSIFSEILFYEGIDNSGRQTGEIIELLKKGAIKKGYDEQKITTFIEPDKAWETALLKLEKNKIIVILSAKPEETLKIINQNK
ncbi:MAG: cyanophycin synthetase [Bacteroidetes bacterium]|nr:cyanophycin synthetase [Bacteroidota bacterium]